MQDTRHLYLLGVIIQVIKDRKKLDLQSEDFPLLAIPLLVAMLMVLAAGGGIAMGESWRDPIVWPLRTFWFLTKWIAAFIFGFDLYTLSCKWFTPLVYVLLAMCSVILVGASLGFIFSELPKMNSSEFGWFVIICTFSVGFLLSYKYNPKGRV